MPERSGFIDLRKVLQSFERRIEEVSRLFFQQVDQMAEQRVLRVYSWQSWTLLRTGLGTIYPADCDGYIYTVRADRSSADGTSTAVIDVLHNGVSMFDGVNYPNVPAGERIGLEISTRRAEKNRYRFKKGDAFQMNVLNTGGGTGPLRVTIMFLTDIPKVLGSASPGR